MLGAGFRALMDLLLSVFTLKRYVYDVCLKRYVYEPDECAGTHQTSAAPDRAAGASMPYTRSL